MGSGGNELPLGRELRMNFARSEGAGSEWPKCAQQSEPQPIASTGSSVRIPPAMELRQQARKRNTAKNEPQREAKAATEAPKVPRTVEVSTHFVCTMGFYQDLCLSRLRKSRNRVIL